MGCSQSKANDVVVAAKPTEFNSTPKTVEQSSTVVPPQQQISNSAPTNVQTTQNANQLENKQIVNNTSASTVNKEVKASPKADVKESTIIPPTPATTHSNTNNSTAKVETQNSSLASPQQPSSPVDSSQFTERLIAITPHVGFVIKTKRLDTNEKVFINVLFHGAVTGSVPGDAQSSVDKKGEKCVAYSVIVPANIYQVSKTHESPEMNHVSLHAIDLINATYDVSLDREFKLPKMKRGFVGDAVEEVYITVLDKVTPPPTPATPAVVPPSAPVAAQNTPSLVVAPVEKKEASPAKEEPKAVPTPQPVEPTPVVAPVAAPKEEEPTASYDVTFTENNTHQFTEEEDTLQLISQVVRPVPPKMHGWLKKRGHIVLNWKSRYFVLDNGYLTYYVDKLDCPPFGKDMKGQLCLAGYREKEITETSTAAAAGRRTSSTANGGVDAVLWLNRIHLVYDPSLITTQDAPGAKGKGTGEDDEYQDLLLEASNSDEKHAWLAAIQAHTEYFESTLSLVSPLLHVVQSSTSLAEEDVAEDGEGGQKAAKRGSTLSVSPNQRSMSKAASRHNSTYSVLDDKKRWCIFLQTGEELVMTGLTGKPNPVGIHLIRQLVLTSRKRLIYIDTKTMEVKGEVQWSSNPTAAYPSAKKIDETTFEIHESAKKVYRFIVKDTCTAAQWVTAISNVEAPSSSTGK